MRIVGFGTYDRTKHPRVGILLDGLAQLGDDVTELNAPLGFSTAERVAMLGKPWLGYRLALRMANRWLRLAAGRARLVGRRRPDAVVVGYLGHFDVILARLLFPRTPIVLDLLIFAADTARDRGVTGGLKLKLLDGLDRIAVACATIALVDTDEHVALLPSAARDKAVVAAVGAPDEWFAERAPRADGPVKIIFYGLFTPLQGAPVIGAAIALLPADLDVAITMVGTGQDLAETRSRAGDRPGVRWVPWVESSELPALVAEQDICLGIFGTTGKGQRVAPNKVFQGAAAGCAIVTSDTEPQRRCLGDAARLVPAGDPATLAQALSSLATDRPALAQLQQMSHRRAEDRFRPRSVATPLRLALVRALDEKRAR